VARVILDLAESGYMNGQTIQIDGGVFPPAAPKGG